MLKKALVSIAMTAFMFFGMTSQVFSDSNSYESTSAVIFTTAISSDERTYVGTKVCLSCHEDKKSFLETGHNYKLIRQPTLAHFGQIFTVLL